MDCINRKKTNLQAGVPVLEDVAAAHENVLPAVGTAPGQLSVGPTMLHEQPSPHWDLSRK